MGKARRGGGVMSHMGVALALAVLLGISVAVIPTMEAGATTTQTVTITAAGETPYNIPANTLSLQVTALGASGSATSSGGAPPAGRGAGASVIATLLPPFNVNPLYVEVNQGGGFSSYAALGGGESAVQTCSIHVACIYNAIAGSDPRIVVAGGGGGGGEYPLNTTGAGGVGGSAGTTASVTAPGAGGAGTNAVNGVGGAGGNAGVGNSPTTSPGGVGSTQCGGAGGTGTPGLGGIGENALAGASASGGGGGSGWVGGSGGGAGACTFGSAPGGGGGGGAGTSFVESGASNVAVSVATLGATPEVIITATIRGVPTTPTITNMPADPVSGYSFVPVVSTNGDGTTSVTSSTPLVCTDGPTVSFLTSGTCTLVAHVTAGTTFTAADGTPQSVTVLASIHR